MESVFLHTACTLIDDHIVVSREGSVLIEEGSCIWEEKRDILKQRYGIIFSSKRFQEKREKEGVDTPNKAPFTSAEAYGECI